MVEPQPTDFTKTTASLTPEARKAPNLPQPDPGYFYFGPIFSNFEHPGYCGVSPNSMPDNAPHRTAPAREWSRPENRRRQSNPQAPTRPPGFHPPAASPPAVYNYPPPLGQHVESIYPSSGPGQAFQNPGLHYTPPAYPQSPGYYGQYTAPGQHAMSIPQSAPYSYPHGYQSPSSSDSNSNRRDVQPSFQSIAQSHPAQYYQQQRSPSSASSTSAIRPQLTPATPRYPSHPSSPTGNLPQPPYMGPGHFGGMSFASPMGTPQYAYPQHYPTTPPMYRPYGPVAYPPHGPSVPEEGQGPWYFVSHANAPLPHYQYEGPQFQNPYGNQYPTQSADLTPYAPQPSAPSASHSLAAPIPTVPGTSHSAPPVELPPRSAESGSKSGSSRPPSAPADSKPVTRREWHPRPPPHRSPWVMWVGNVPSDATQEELTQFFSLDQPEAPSEADGSGAVVSIFLIARSNCAFINYSTEASLLTAIQNFNGKRLRPNDPQCPMLVCKVRRSADDLKSGVGGQRGTGLHVQWVKEQRKLRNPTQGGTATASYDPGESPSSVPGQLSGSISSMLSADPPRPRGTNQSSSSESYASTSSSFLGEHFPTRYFILKSLSERDLELSVESGLWATQKHNELVLDRAYRTSANVYLIFSVNKSGEFYGFARMAGPIRQGEGSVSWSSRSHLSPSSQLSSSSSVPFSVPDGRLITDGPVYQSPEELLRPRGNVLPSQPHQAITTAQPASLAEDRQEFDHYASAPARLGGVEDSDVERSPSMKLSLDQHQRRQTRAGNPGFHLDPRAPFKAMRHPDGRSGDQGTQPSLESVKEGKEESDGRAQVAPAKPSPTWGDCFKVEWRELRKVPFHKTRHLRNAWNKGREIKVSRDGTELESSVGSRLLEEWEELATQP